MSYLITWLSAYAVGWVITLEIFKNRHTVAKQAHAPLLALITQICVLHHLQNIGNKNVIRNILFKTVLSKNCKKRTTLHIQKETLQYKLEHDLKACQKVTLLGAFKFKSIFFSSELSKNYIKAQREPLFIFKKNITIYSGHKKYNSRNK